MQKQDWISVLITFTVGFVAGGYLYLTGFAEVKQRVEVPDSETVTELSIISDAYGGCRNLCPSFLIKHDGSYRYLYHLQDGNEPIIKEGNLPLSYRLQLKKHLVAEELTKQSKSSIPNSCASYVDGADFMYQITLDNVEYKLDSCGTAIDKDSELWQSLRNVWIYLQESR